ncbi:bifunctional 3-phenylpropionate/cinnamic acid dioxygenase ferredoxin subunit [Actinocorallia sp. B10E7]|uniref:bifunctional 3-phenylpropionate/cinnamic acid dioxygenase ferredoxin subunit n=1 Tax=Actinocorallia sp. B10E7 TaxID=3153558 RepID=UPI00325D3804
MTDTLTRWVRVCSVAEVPEDEGFVFATVPPVSVFRSGDELFCIDDTCTHETFSLAEGWVEDCVVECTLHMAKFDLRTGRALCPPASRAVRTHPVRAEDGDVLVALPADYTLPKES